MPRYSENPLWNLIQNIPGLAIGRRGAALRNARENPTAAIGAVFPWAYNPEHGGSLGENIASRFRGMGDGFGDALDSARGLFGNGFDPSRMEAHQRGDPFDFDTGRFDEVSQQRFDESLARRDDRPQLPGINVRSGASGSGQSAGSSTIATGVNAQRMFEAMRDGQRDQSQAARQAMAMMFRGAEK